MVCDRGDLAAGAALGVFGVYVISVAVKLPYVSEVGPGPGFFPLWLGIGLVLFGAGLMFAAFAYSAKEPRNESQSLQMTMRSLAGWVAVMVAIALLGTIGFLLSFVILTVFLIVALDRQPVLLAVGVGLGLAAVFYLVFVMALDVSLPKAVWGF